MTESFSVLLSVYAGDTPEFFIRAFRSASVEQDLRPDQVVVVQDGPVAEDLSTAINAAVAESPIPTALVVLEHNSGLARALDIGLSACAHEVVARMDADDIAEPNRFRTQLDVIGRGYDIVGSAILEFSEDRSGERSIGVRVPPLEHREIVRYSRFHSPFNHPTVVFRRSAVAAAGGYRDLHLMEDYWLFARMILSGAMTANVPTPLVRYRVSSGAYDRRGGMDMLRSEIVLQSHLRRIHFTTRGQFVRNILVRGIYRLVPVRIRRGAYRRLVARDFRRS